MKIFLKINFFDGVLTTLIVTNGCFVSKFIFVYDVPPGEACSWGGGVPLKYMSRDLLL